MFGTALERLRFLSAVTIALVRAFYLLLPAG